jgi:DNA topoisomerase-1
MPDEVRMIRRNMARLTDPVESARAAGLRYVRETSAGFTRRRAGKGFCYLDTEGKPLRDKEHLDRIRSLVIPPAWERVWICPLPNGHLQAIGYDAKGRKQYRYHPIYAQFRNHTKFGRMPEFAQALPSIRHRVLQDLSKPALPREKVLATVVRLLETTYIRIGNKEYAKQNHSFGLTTLRDRHVAIEGGTVRFHFRGKSGQDHEVELHDRRLARIVRECQDLPGYELFQYVDRAGNRHTIDSNDVNLYLREIAGGDFTAKDFRTWAGTVQSALELAAAGPAESETAIKRNVANVIKTVASRLGNRPATCRKYYVHPLVVECYAQGTLFSCVKPPDGEFTPTADALHPEEQCVLKLIKQFAGPKQSHAAAVQSP